jgi:hypothetical protein
MQLTSSYSYNVIILDMYKKNHSADMFVLYRYEQYTTACPQ